MNVSRPVTVSLPASGILFAESVHAPDFTMQPRADAFHKMLYVLRGRVSYRAEGRSDVKAESGAAILVPAGVRHVLADEQPSTLLLLCLAPGAVEHEVDVAEVWRGLTRRLPNPIRGPAAREVESCWRRAMLEKTHPRPGSALAIRALAWEVLVQLSRAPAAVADDSAEARVRAVVRELEGAFFERWSLDGAAARAGMSRRHFTAQFRAFTGRSFAEHLTEIRLTHAARLLREGEHSLTGVIFASGFGDVSQFYRLFRARFGLPPGRWLAEA